MKNEQCLHVWEADHPFKCLYCSQLPEDYSDKQTASSRTDWDNLRPDGTLHRGQRLEKWKEQP